MRSTALVYILFVLAWSTPANAQSGQIAEPVEREHFVYQFDNPSYIKVADTVLERVRIQLLGILGDTLSYKPTVFMAGDQETFNRLLGGRFPDWGAGVAIRERHAIVIKSPDKFNTGKSLTQLLTHEYAHLLVAHLSGFQHPPRWFDEGVAMLVSVEWTWADNLAMSKVAVFGKFLPLDSIEMVNRFNQSKAQIAYAQSYLAVQYLIENYGAKSPGRFLTLFRLTGKVDSALIAASGATAVEFEHEYHDYLRTRYNLVTLFTDTMFFWLGLALVVLIGVFLRYRKRRQYFKKWEQEEQLQSTDFDYGNPNNPEKTDDDFDDDHDDEPWRS